MLFLMEVNFCAVIAVCAAAALALCALCLALLIKLNKRAKRLESRLDLLEQRLDNGLDEGEKRISAELARQRHLITEGLSALNENLTREAMRNSKRN